MLDNDQDRVDELLLAQLFPNIASQIRTALGGIHFAATALAPADVREKSQQIDSAAAMLDLNYYRLLRLVNNLSAAAGLSDERLLPTRDQDLVDLVRLTCQQSESLAGLLELRLTFRCQEERHLCAVYRDSVEQLLFQLLSNAFKFTPRGGTVTVTLRFARGQALLSVEDTGCGISEERLPTLFSRYLQTDQMDPPPHGLGLGLPLCRRIAAGHGGGLMAESRVGKGTCVTLAIPDHQTGTPALSDIPFDYAGGFNRTLLSLSDALPSSAFRLHNQD